MNAVFYFIVVRLFRLKRKEDIDDEMPSCFHEADHARIVIKRLLYQRS